MQRQQYAVEGTMLAQPGEQFVEQRLIGRVVTLPPDMAKVARMGTGSIPAGSRTSRNPAISVLVSRKPAITSAPRQWCQASKSASVVGRGTKVLVSCFSSAIATRMSP